jgi:flavodoxin
MKRVLIIYYSSSGTTEKMAAYIAEGVRFTGNEAVIKNIEVIKSIPEVTGYDGYILGSPTYSSDVPEPMKAFLLVVAKADLKGKIGGTFGPYRHDVGYKHDFYAPAIILDTLLSTCGMKPFELGPFSLKENIVETSEGIRACQDYGRVFGEKLDIREKGL